MGADARTGCERNRLPLIAAGRSSTTCGAACVAPATAGAARCSAWTVAARDAARRGRWPRSASSAFPLCSRSSLLPSRPAARSSRWRVFLRVAVRGPRGRRSRRPCLQLTLLAYHACEMLHAIVLTLVRLVITQRRLLEWETAAASDGARCGLPRRAPRLFVAEMVGEPRRRALLVLLVLVAAAARALAAAAAVRSLLWLAAPVRRLPAEPAASSPQRRALDAADRALPRRVGAPHLALLRARSWDREDHWLPPDNFQEAPGRERRAPHVADQHRHGAARRRSPRTTSASSTAGRSPSGIDATLDDDRGARAPRGPPAQLVRHADARAAAAALRLDRRQRQPGRRLDGAGGGAEEPRPRQPPEPAPHLARARARARVRRRHADFRFLYDPQRRLFADRLPPRRTPTGPAASTPPTTTCSPPRRGSRASSRSRKGDVPQAHWFRLGRPLASVDGAPTLLSWSGDDVRVPDAARCCTRTLPGARCSTELPDARSRRQIDVRPSRSACPGASPSRPTTSSTATGHYQYKAFGVPGLGPEARPRRRRSWSRPTRRRSRRWSIRRGRGREPRARCAAEGLARPLRLLRGDRLHAARRRRAGRARARRRREPGTDRAGLLRPPPGHDASSRSRTSCADDVMVRRFHADPRVQATELLLQERVPRDVPIAEPRPAESTRRAAAAPRRPRPRALPLAAHRRARTRTSSRTARYTDGRHERRRRRQLLPRPVGHALARGRDARPGEPVHLPARRPQRGGLVGDPPADAPRGRRVRRALPAREGGLPPARRRDRDAARDRGLARGRRRGAPRSRSRTAATASREIEVTSYAEIVLGDGRPTTSRTRRSASCSSRPSTCPSSTALAVPAAAARARASPARARSTSLSVEGGCAGRRRVGDRPRRASSAAAATSERSGRARRPAALGTHRRRARPDREPAPARAPRARRLRARSRSRPASRSAATPAHRARAEVPRLRRAAARAFALAFTHAQIALRHLGITPDEAQLFERLASRVLCVDPSLRADPGGPRAQRARPVRASGRTASRATCRSCSCAWSRTTTCRSCGRCCRPRSTGG